MRPILVDLLEPWVGRQAAYFLAPSFFMMAGVAVLAAVWLAVRQARRAGVDVRVVLNAFMALYVGMVAGGIVVPMLVAAVQSALAGHGLVFRWAGMVSFAGMACGLLAAWLVVRRSPVGWPRFLDLVAAPAGLALCFARLGCFVAGCDFGRVSDSALALRFPGGSPAWNAHVHAGLVPEYRDASLPVHPTQLYEAFLGLALMALALWGLPRLERAWKKLPPGGYFYVLGGGYALGRATIEGLRGDTSRGVFGALSTGHIASAFILAVVIALLWRGRRRMLATGAAAAALFVALAAGAPRAAQAKEWTVHGELATSAPMNRREGQVPPLGGFGLGVTLNPVPDLLFSLEYETVASGIAAHNTFFLGGQGARKLGDKLTARAGLWVGYTFVNFSDRSFLDVAGTTWRVSASVDLRVATRWSVSVTPIGFDYLMAPDLGGPIVSYTASFGLTYHFGTATAALQTMTPPPAGDAGKPNPFAPAAPASPAPAPAPAPAPPAPAQPISPY